jgi:hypothetical protein
VYQESEPNFFRPRKYCDLQRGQRSADTPPKSIRRRGRTFKVGRWPRNIVFTPDRQNAYVNAENDGGIVLFDPIK